MEIQRVTKIEVGVSRTKTHRPAGLKELIDLDAVNVAILIFTQSRPDSFVLPSQSIHHKPRSAPPERSQLEGRAIVMDCLVNELLDTSQDRYSTKIVVDQGDFTSIGLNAFRMTTQVQTKVDIK